MNDEYSSKSNWKSLKKMVKNRLQEVKKKIKEYTNEDKLSHKQNQQFYGTQRRIITEHPPNKDYICPFCQSTISSELIEVLKENKSIICEHCGSSLQQSDFFN